MKSAKLIEPLPPPDPPTDLSERSAILWRQVVTRPTSAARVETLRLAFVLLDDYEKVREIIAQEGMTKTSGRSGLAHRHPLLDSYFRLQKELRKSWRDLRLELGGGASAW